MNHTTLNNGGRQLSNEDRRWNNTCREHAAKFLELAKWAKCRGHKKLALEAMRDYHRCMRLIVRE